MMQRQFIIASVLSLAASACQPAGGGDTTPENRGGAGGRAGSGGRTAGSGGNESGGSGGGGSSNPMTGGTAGGSAGGSGGMSQTDAGGGTDGQPNAGNSDCTAQQPDSLFCKPLGAMPKSIKATGLFASAPDLTKQPKSALEFAPNPELWSDGMTKQRFLLLPAGTKIDNSDRKRWDFPVGTVFVKTFFDDTGAAGAPKPIETRFIRRIKSDGAVTDYDYYVYNWNAAGTDADLAMDDMNGDVKKTIPRMITINHMVNGQPLRINNGMPFQHDLPSREMCGDCHAESGMQGQTFIGFDEVRLNSKRVATATKTQLQEFADLGVFKMPVPSDPATITDPDARVQRIKRSLFGNCVHCHNGGSVFDMSPGVLIENIVNQRTEAQSVKPPDGFLRVVPGNPTNSVVYRQMQRTNLPPPKMASDERLRPMPPVGVADIAVDRASLEDVRLWIMSLPPQPPPPPDER